MKKKSPFTISDARFRAFVEKSWDVLVIVDRSTKVLYATPSIIRMFGREVDEFMGIKGLRFVHPHDLSRVLKVFARVIASTKGTTIDTELRILHKKGYYKWIEARATNLLQDPEIRAVVINFHDITASKELEQKKNEFISITGHELRTPITVLKLYTQILSHQMQQESLSSLPHVVKKMEYQINQLGRLVDDLLDVSRIQENKLTLQKQAINLEQFVKEVVADLQMNTVTHKIVLRSRYHGNVHADKFRLTQALVNIITNAIKYSPDTNRIMVTISASKEVINIRVKDFGIGISKIQQKNIFERFFQASGENTTEGLGLGLYITSNIIKAHDGQLRVLSEKGKGTTFTIQLPRVRKEKESN